MATAGMAMAVVGLAVGTVSPDPPDGSLVEYDRSFRSEFAIILGLSSLLVVTAVQPVYRSIRLITSIRG